MTDYTDVKLYEADYKKALIDEGFLTLKFIVRERPNKREETMYEVEKAIKQLLKEKFQMSED